MVFGSVGSTATAETRPLTVPAANGFGPPPRLVSVWPPGIWEGPRATQLGTSNAAVALDFPAAPADAVPVCCFGVLLRLAARSALPMASGGRVVAGYLRWP